MLTKRQRDIVKLVMAGKTSKEIAESFTVSPRTVEATLHNIYQKLECNNRASLVNRVHEGNLLNETVK